MTPKQQAFVSEFCVDFNGTQAAIRAGYSPRSAAAIANENLTKPEIAAAVREKTALMNRATELTAEYVRSELLKTYEEAKREGWSNADRVRLLALMVKVTDGAQVIEMRSPLDRWAGYSTAELKEILAAGEYTPRDGELPLLPMG